MKIALRIFAVVIIAAMTIGAMGALDYSPILPERWRALAAGSYAVITVLAFLFLRRRGRTAIVAVIAFAVASATALSRGGDGDSQNSRRGNFVTMTVEESEARVDTPTKGRLVVK